MRLLNKKPRWHLIYYLLGIIDVIAICVSLFLNNVITEKYQNAVTINEYWSKVRLRLQIVEVAASTIGMPGNDIFESKDVAKEREIFASALLEFDRRNEEFKSFIALRSDLTKSLSISDKLDRIEGKIEDMKLATDNVFTAFSDERFERASFFMAKLDQDHRDLRQITSDLAIRFTEIQNLSLEEDGKKIEQLRLIDRFVAFFVIIMVFGVVLYGRKISKFVISTTAEISESKDLYAAIVHASAQLIWEIDAHGRFTRDHGSWCDFTGLTPELAAGNGWLKAVTPDEQEKVEAFIFTGMSKKTPFEFECQLKRSDGRWRTFQVRAIPIQKNDAPSFWVLAGNDVSEFRAAESRLRETNFALDQSAIVAFTDKAGKITFVNDSFCKISGFSREELIDQDHRLLNSNYHDKEFFQSLWKTIATGNVWRGEVKNKRKDGTFYWVDSTIVPMKNSSGKIHQYVAIRNDITQKKESEELIALQRRQLDQFFDLSGDLLSITHVDGSFKKVSLSFEKTLGYSTSDVRSMSMLDMVHPDDIPAAAKEIEKLAAGKPTISFRNRIRTKDGRYVSISWASTPSADGTLYTVGRDITQEILSEKNLIDAKERAEVAAKTKASFLANMSHEIRTPMNGVIGNTALLMETDLSKDQQEMVATIKSSGDALLTLIDDILDFSKIEAGKLQIEHSPFDIRQVVNDAIKIVSPAASAKKIFLRAAIDDSVPGVLVSDYTRFRQVLLNLLNNAIKFTNKGGVKVAVGLGNNVDEKFLIKVTVEDSGIGMTLSQQSMLFQEFSQVDASTTRKYGGTGLGLAICKHLCTLLGGRIWVDSTPDKGSTFSFTILAASGVGLEPVNTMKFVKEDGGPVMGSEFPLRILVVDDSKTNQVLARKFFKKLGYDVEIAENGDQAFNAAARSPFDIIFMDVQMPVMDGYEATKKIRAQISSDQQPYIIALTAGVMQTDRQLCFDAGMDDFLKKPLEFSDLKSVLQKFLSERSGEAVVPKVDCAVQVEGVDLAAILRTFDNDFEMFQAVAGVYLGDCQNYLDRIEASLVKNDANELEAAAHALKGAVNNFSKSLVTITASQMETFGREGKMGDASKLFPRLAEEAFLLKSKLSEFISTRNAA